MNIFKKNKRLQQLVSSIPFCLENFSEIVFQKYIDVLIQNDFRVIQKITFAQLRKANLVIIISFFNFNIKWKKLGRKKKNNTKLKTKRAFFVK